MWIYFWALYSVPLIHMSVFVPIPCCFDYCSIIVLSEVWEGYTSSFVLSQDCFGYSGFFCGSKQILGLLFLFIWIMPLELLFLNFEFYLILCHWNFDRYCVESTDRYGWHGHFNNLCIHEHGISFHLYLQFLSTKSCSYLFIYFCTDLLLPWLN